MLPQIELPTAGPIRATTLQQEEVDDVQEGEDDDQSEAKGAEIIQQQVMLEANPLEVEIQWPSFHIAPFCIDCVGWENLEG